MSSSQTDTEEHDYMISVRLVREGDFITEPGGRTRFLKVPRDQERPNPSDALPQRRWFEEVRDLADGRADKQLDPGGDVLIFVHGYNNDHEIILKRQRQLQKDLQNEGFQGLVVVFDWPSADRTLNYLEDRWDASATADKLVIDGIALLARGQREGCQTNVHLLGHSTGAFVIREAFHKAQRSGELYKQSWRVGQVVFIAADISSASMAAENQESQPMFQRMMRLTNYSNIHDKVLKVSHAKRLGVRARLGRAGLPAEAPPSCVNVACNPFFEELDPDAQPVFGTFVHSWHIGNPVFARDLAMTLQGGLDGHVLPTRFQREGGALALQEGQRFAYEARWLEDRKDG